jgi:esterase/lipase
MKTLNLFKVFIVLAVVGSFSLSHASENQILEARSIEEFDGTQSSIYLAAKTPSVRSVLIIHGLNLKPTKMNALSRFYHEEGFNVLRLSLTGHADDFERLKKITAEDWIADVKKGFRFLAGRHDAKQIDLLGYSLGAIAGVAAEQAHRLEFARMVLLAPPFEVTAMSAMVQSLFEFENLSIPSRFSPAYRAGYSLNPSTPIPAYKALFKLRELVQKSVPSGFINKFGIVFASDRDEVVDAKKSRNFVEAVSAFETVRVEKANSKVRPEMHHLIIDRESLGDTWDFLLQEIRRFNAIRY